MNSIAKRYGFLLKTLWNHPQNASLKNLRKDPNILFPGDVVHMPDKKEAVENRPTDQLHTFALKSNICKLRIRILRDDKPLAQEPYQMNIDGTWFEGQTDGDGKLEQEIPGDAREGKLVLSKTGEEYPLDLGHMDPIAEIAGIQKRLQNLGFFIGNSADGILGPKTASGVKEFQHKNGLAADGIPGPITKAKLIEVHGC